MEEEFDSEEVIKLVTSALEDKGSNALDTGQTIPLGMAQGDLLATLFMRLGDHLPTPQVQMIFDDLREELYEGIEMPDLKELHTVTKNCRKCGIAAKADQHLPKWNVSDPDCVFVTDTPFYAKESAEFFVDSLVQSNFKSTRVCLTYVNRCPAVESFKSEHVANCAPYLRTELQILRPKLIVTMGLLPLVTLLGTDVKLGEMRGSVVWLGPWAILPTYSPSYALRSGGAPLNNFKIDLTTAYNFCYG